MNPRKAFYAFTLAILTLFPLNLINQDTIIRDDGRMEIIYTNDMVHEEVQLRTDSTFYYFSGGCLGEESGTGTYLIVKDTLKLYFPPMPKEISSLYKVDSFPSINPDSSKITINYYHLSDTIDGTAIMFNYFYDMDSILIDKDLLITDNDTVYTIIQPLNSNYLNLKSVGIGYIDKDVSLSANNDYKINIAAEYLINQYIYNKKLSFYIDRKDINTWNKSILITQEQDTLVIQPIK